jgi:formylmethanofuran dehydrogenase subunit D
MKKIFSNSAVAKSTKEQLMAAMEKATNSSADKKNKADRIYRTLGSMISDTWTNKNEMHTHAIDIFKRAYAKIGIELEGMTEKDKIVAAQQMTDIILNTYSPVASDKNLSNDEIAAQYGNNYAIRKMDIEAMQKFMDYNGDMNELLTEVKSELGIDAPKPEEQKQEEKMPEKVEFRPNTFNENNADKSEKVDVLEHDDKQLKI